MSGREGGSRLKVQVGSAQWQWAGARGSKAQGSKFKVQKRK